MQYKKLLISIPLIIIGATIAIAAYTPPPSFPTDTPVVPVTEGDVAQLKEGALSVNAFAARGTGVFGQFDAPGIGYTTIEGKVYGCAVAGVACPPESGVIDNNTTVTFGTASDPVNILASGDVETKFDGSLTKGLSSVPLTNTTLRRVCATQIGELILCEE